MYQYHFFIVLAPFQLSQVLINITCFCIQCYLIIELENCRVYQHLPGNQDQHDVFQKGSPEDFVTFIWVSLYAEVGWIPIVSSKMFLVNPILMATANPCIISPAFGPV